MQQRAFINWKNCPIPCSFIVWTSLFECTAYWWRDTIIRVAEFLLLLLASWVNARLMYYTCLFSRNGSVGKPPWPFFANFPYVTGPGANAKAACTRKSSQNMQEGSTYCPGPCYPCLWVFFSFYCQLFSLHSATTQEESRLGARSCCMIWIWVCSMAW